MRLLVRFMADTVTNELSDDAEPGLLHVLLDRGADISEPGSRPGLGQSEVQRLARDPQQTLRLRSDTVDRNRNGRVGEQPARASHRHRH